MAKKPLEKVQYSLMLDRQWLSLSSIPLSGRLRYIFEKYHALLRRKSSVNYLGCRPFNYDNRNTPATLQSYPDEILQLNQWLDFSSPKRVLDIGANVGQFSTTLASLFPGTRIDSFEPNPIIFELLRKNTGQFGQIRIYNNALGPPGNMPFYFVPGASAKGSFIEANATINLGKVTAETVAVDIVTLDDSTIDKFHLATDYDLIKIDVEGFEYEVLDAIKCSAQFMYVEFSSGRSHSYTFSQLLNRIEGLMGNVEILYCDKIDTSDPARTIGSLLVGKAGNSVNA